MTLALLVAGIVGADPADVVAEGQERLAQARSMYVRSFNRLTGVTTERWFLRPNRFRVVASDGFRSTCNGHWVVERTGETWHRRPAPKRLTPAFLPAGFEAFADPEAAGVGEVWEAEFSLDGRNRPALSVKTTESAIFYGLLYFDARTGLPLGETMSEYAETVVSVEYREVKLDQAMSPRDFSVSAVFPGASPPWPPR